jgi:G3E family GTPase
MRRSNGCSEADGPGSPMSDATHAPAEDRRVPVIVLTGFLGAGKTTLLNHVVGQPEMAGTAVLINEFGEIGVDHHLVEKIDETLMVLDSGCICCSVQGDLVRALKGLFQRAARREIAPVTRVLIETTGLADPAPVIHTLMEDPFIAGRYRCDGVITAVDATHGESQLDEHREALRQVAMADRLLVTKCDLASPAQRASLGERLARLNPGAQRIEVFGGMPPPGAISGCGLYDPAGKTPDVALWLGEEAARAQAATEAMRTAPIAWRKPGAAAAHAPARHDDRIQSYVLTFDEPLDWLGFSDGLGLILQAYGERILRVKGLLNVAGDPLPRVIQCVQHVAYPPSSLPAWPDVPPCDDRRSRLVFIVRDLPRAEVESILGSLSGQMPRPEQT